MAENNNENYEMYSYENVKQKFDESIKIKIIEAYMDAIINNRYKISDYSKKIIFYIIKEEPIYINPTLESTTKTVLEQSFNIPPDKISLIINNYELRGSEKFDCRVEIDYS